MTAGYRALVIDAGPSLDQVSAVLRDEGFEVRVARARWEALSLLHAWRPHLVVLGSRSSGLFTSAGSLAGEVGEAAAGPDEC